MVENSIKFKNILEFSEWIIFFSWRNFILIILFYFIIKFFIWKFKNSVTDFHIRIWKIPTSNPSKFIWILCWIFENITPNIFLLKIVKDKNHKKSKKDENLVSYSVVSSISLKIVPHSLYDRELSSESVEVVWIRPAFFWQHFILR